MCCLSLDELSDDERAELLQAKALLDPYIKISAVDWTAKSEDVK